MQNVTVSHQWYECSGNGSTDVLVELQQVSYSLVTWCAGHRDHTRWCAYFCRRDRSCFWRCRRYFRVLRRCTCQILIPKS